MESSKDFRSANNPPMHTPRRRRCWEKTLGWCCRTRVHLLHQSWALRLGQWDGMLPSPRPPPSALSPLLKPENPRSSGRCVGPRCPEEPESTKLQCAVGWPPLTGYENTDKAPVAREGKRTRKTSYLEGVVTAGGQSWGHGEKGGPGGGCSAPLLVPLLPLTLRVDACLQVPRGFLQTRHTNPPPLLAGTFPTPETWWAGQQQPVPLTTPYTQTSAPGCRRGSTLPCVRAAALVPILRGTVCGELWQMQRRHPRPEQCRPGMCLLGVALG